MSACPHLGRVVGGDLDFRYFYQLLATQAGYAGERPGRGPEPGLIEAWREEIFLTTKVVLLVISLPAVQ